MIVEVVNHQTQVFKTEVKYIYIYILKNKNIRNELRKKVFGREREPG